MKPGKVATSVAMERQQERVAGSAFARHEGAVSSQTQIEIVRPRWLVPGLVLLAVGIAVAVVLALVL